MAKIYTTPGVYVEEISKFPPSIASVETAIPAFIGYTEKAEKIIVNDLKLKPFRISSMQEYLRYFGGPQKEEGIVIAINETQVNGVTTDIKADATLSESSRSKYIMYYALQMFFANGGGTCWIVSVGKYLSVFGTAPRKAKLLKGLKVLAKEDEPTLIVFPEAQNLPIADYKSLQDAALLQCKTMQDRFVIMDVPCNTVSLLNQSSALLQCVNNFRNDGIGINNLKYGAAYCPNIETTLDYSFDESKTHVVHLLNGTVSSSEKLISLKETDSTKYGIAIASISTLPCIMPPSGAIAGIYAAVDRTRGVWKAPANVSISNCIKPIIPITDRDQENMNVDPSSGKSVNAIRTFTGKGTLVWGARTLAGNDNEWRYVNVSRFFIFIEESVKKGTEHFVFEPNDANTWIRVQATIEGFLTNLWRQGALQGTKPEHAFYVSVGLGKTMTALDIIEGRMIIEMGVAAVRPAEFKIIRFSLTMAKA